MLFETEAESTHHVLMRVHEYSKAIVAATKEDFDYVIDVFVIVLLRSRMFDGLPCEHETQSVPTPRAQSTQMNLYGIYIVRASCAHRNRLG
jgi:hypothetical protein